LLAGARAVAGLGASSGSAGTTMVTIPADVTAGSYCLIAKADADGVVVETQEGNNVTARNIAIGPDLTISALTVPYTITAGSTVSVAETVLNQGAGAAGASTTRFYLSANVTLDAGDVVLDSSRSVPTLAAGAASGGTTPLTIPAGTAPGTYYFFAKADSDGTVVESQESNNISWRAIQVTAGQ
jgi:subtilase family serine protease